MEPLSLDDKLNFQLLDENLELESPNLSPLESPIKKHVGGGFSSGYIHKGMTLKEQERIIDDLRKENYNLKMRIYFLEDTMNKMSPSYVNEAIKENVDLKTKLERSNTEKRHLADQLQKLQSKSDTVQSQKNEVIESHHQRQLDMLKSHIETLETQLMEVREAKLQLEDKDLRHRETYLSAKNQSELALKQVDSLKTELQFVQDQANRYKQELIDAQVQLHNAEQKLNKFSKSRTSYFNGEEEGEDPKSKAQSQYLEKMKHLKSHIQAQTLVITEREKQMKELQNQVTILTEELNARDHLDVYKPPTSQSQGQDQRSSALYIQLTELHRQANERAREATRLQSELKLQKEIHAKTLREIEGQYQQDFQQVQQQHQEVKEKYQLLHENFAQLKATHEQTVASHKEQNKNIKEAEKAWENEKKQYENTLARLNREMIQLKNEVIKKGQAVFYLQEEIASRVHKEQSVVDQMDVIQKKCQKVDAKTQSTRFEIEAMEEALRKAQAKTEEIENAWRKETERRCHVEQRELTRVAELDDFLRTERQVNKNLQARLVSLEQDIEVLKQTHEREVNELQALARVGNEVDRLQTTDHFQSKLLTLEKENQQYQDMLGKLKNALKVKAVELQTYKDRLAHVQATADDQYDRLTRLLQHRSQSSSSASSSPSLEPLSSKLSPANAASSSTDISPRTSRRPMSLIETKTATTATISYDTLYQIFINLATTLGKNISEFSFNPVASILEAKVVEYVHEVSKIKLYFETRCKSIESHWTKEFRLLLNKFEHKAIQIQKYEEAIRTATFRVRQWKSILNRQHIEALTSETEKMKLQKKLNDSLEEEEQVWQLKLDELEKKLKESELRTETERLGAKKKVDELIHTIRELERQLDAAKELNQRYKEIAEQRKQNRDKAHFDELNEAHEKAEHSLQQKEFLLKKIITAIESIPNPTPELIKVAQELRRNLDPMNETISGNSQLPDPPSRPSSTT